MLNVITYRCLWKNQRNSAQISDKQCMRYDHNKQLITFIVITLSGLCCIVKRGFTVLLFPSRKNRTLWSEKILEIGGTIRAMQRSLKTEIQFWIQISSQWFLFNKSIFFSLSLFLFFSLSLYPSFSLSLFLSFSLSLLYGIWNQSKDNEYNNHLKNWNLILN